MQGLCNGQENSAKDNNIDIYIGVHEVHRCSVGDGH